MAASTLPSQVIEVIVNEQLYSASSPVFRLPRTLLPEAARDVPGLTMCLEPAHQTSPLEFFCEPCDRAICFKCKLTKHECHSPTLDLIEAVARCRDRLVNVKGPLEQSARLLTKKSAAALENLNAARKKGVEMKEEIEAEANALVTIVLKRRDAILDQMDQSNSVIERTLSRQASAIHQELDKVLQLQQRVHYALGGSASHAEVFDVEKETRSGSGITARLEQAEVSCFPAESLRPGLRPDRISCKESDIDLFLGTPVALTVPFEAGPEMLAPIYQCGQVGFCRWVHSVCHVTDDFIYISFGGSPPDYEDEKSICVNDRGQVIKWLPLPEMHRNSKFTCMKFNLPQQAKSTYMVSTPMSAYYLHAKGAVPMATTQKDGRTQTVRTITVESESPLQTKSAPLFDVHCGKAVAFDATHDGQLFAFVEEKTNEQRRIAENTVLLFLRNEREPFAAYRPANVTDFHPTDVCFWRENGQEEKLLVADMHNDAVHVVSVENNQCRFERYLAAGDGLLVRPTAFDVDWQNRIWIGCGNGRILRCDKPGAGQEMSGMAEGDDSSSVDNFEIGLLTVGNHSESTNTESHLSDDVVSFELC